MKMSVYDWIMMQSELSKPEWSDEPLTKSQLGEIRRSGDPDKLHEALDKMEMQGGYDNLPDE